MITTVLGVLGLLCKGHWVGEGWFLGTRADDPFGWKTPDMQLMHEYVCHNQLMS